MLLVLFIPLSLISPHLALSTTLYLLFGNLKARHNGLRALKMFRHNCKDVCAAQQRLLTDIIHKNSATDYGSKFGLATIRSLEDLRKCHPLNTYDHYESYIDRVTQGEPRVMTSDPSTRLCRSSGTTGRAKLISQDNKILLPKVRAVIKGVMHENFPKMTIIQRIMKLYIHVSIEESKCGIPVATATAIDPKTMKYLVSYTIPPEGLLLNNLFDALYIHLLFGLRERSLGVIEATFIMTVEDATRILMSKWENLVEDLKTGTIHEGLNLEPWIRSTLSKALGDGDVTRADEVEVEIRKGPIGIVKRLWPSIAFIGCIDNLGRKSYLQTNIAAGVPIYSYCYNSSEGAQGVNLWPFDDDIQFLPFHDVAVFEFIPEEAMDEGEPPTYFLHEVEVGQNYEVAVTQGCGLYRYRMGDVVRVTGFYRSCPKVSFLYRRAMLLNLDGEKVSQPIVADSLKDALTIWPGLILERYCVVESPLVSDVMNTKVRGASPLHYVFFLQLKAHEGRNLHEVDVQVLSKRVDEGICSRHIRYKQRRINRFSSPEVFLVNDNAFQDLRKYILKSEKVSAVQMKLPLRLRTPEMVEVMLANLL
ncbi:putative indole-3-acetic acid-amido synthetase GH3.11 [Holothuria leucospilota]|uniref:Indole-3-acetic acid-amido synthetase GH3.11 n=1 Tax=Holothuria leucospilota TaxID=206669 RepID=A0A9Q1HF74_HOLLE|nr:putative indole-3-acetic acid-amido synthetase GH3.11 [Holothuria leucospilota]